jgi:RNA polymerase sigma-70 factor, ECF subfamily
MMSAVNDVDPLRRLLDAARDGDDQAVAELVRQTQPLLWRLCGALGSPGEEEDLVQETYLRAFRNAETYRGDAPVRAWLLSIGRHVCADHVRRSQRRRRLLTRLRSVAVAEPVPTSTPIGDLLTRLEPDRRDAFVLTQLVGLPYEEAAAVLGCPIGTVRSRVARARAELFDAVADADAR